MKVLFVDSDPVTRGLMHCMATMAGLDHAVVASGEEALALLRGDDTSSTESWSVRGPDCERVGLVITELKLADMHGDDLAALVRSESPQTRVFAHTDPEYVSGGDFFERMFFKPHSAEAVIRAAIGVVGDQSERDLFQALIPDVDMPAA